jgi:hypothetical protein
MLGDISKTIGKAFLIGACIPSGILVGMNVLFIRWGLLSRDWVHDWDAFGIGKPAAIFAAIFAVALILWLASSLVYRVFEGYHSTSVFFSGLGAVAVGIVLRRTASAPVFATAALAIGVAIALLGIGQLLSRVYHLVRARRLRASLATMEGSRKATAQYRLARRYPRDEGQMRATALGNILRAFEEYPSLFWGIDPITMWARLASVLPEAFAAQIEEAKTVVSLLINLCVVAGWLAFETALLAQPKLWDKWFWASIVWLAVADGAYLAALPAAGRWGEYFRSAFDINRLDLLVKLKIELPTGPFTFAEERDVWAGLQLATFYVEDPGDALQLVVTPKPQSSFRDPWAGVAGEGQK